MSRYFSRSFTVVCVITLALLGARFAKADDAPTTAPSPATGSISVTVVDSDGKPVVKARLGLFAARKVVEGDDNSGAPAKPKRLAKGSTDDDGKYTFEALATGDYRVSAQLKGSKTKVTTNVNVTDTALNPSITVTLTSPPPDDNGATTAPSTMPAQ